jgi:hypothetical protein
LRASKIRNDSCAPHSSKSAKFKSDIQETLDRLDTRPRAILTRDNQPNYRSKKPHDGVSNRTRPNAGKV